MDLGLGRSPCAKHKLEMVGIDERRILITMLCSLCGRELTYLKWAIFDVIRGRRVYSPHYRV